MLTFGMLAAIPTPRLRMPVPASRIRVEPSESSSSTHDVFPPKRFISGPGAGTEPRAPQIFTFMNSPHLQLLLPEEDHRALLAAVGEDRQRGRLDLVGL